MLRINRQTDYAVRVILALAKRSEGTRLSTGEIQQEMLIPPRSYHASWRNWRKPACLPPSPAAMAELRFPAPPPNSHSRMWWRRSRDRSCFRRVYKSKVRTIVPSRRSVPCGQNGGAYKLQCCARWHPSILRIWRKRLNPFRWFQTATPFFNSKFQKENVWIS